VAILLMIVTGLLVVLQQMVLAGKSFTTVGGKAFRPRALDLGAWRYFTLVLAVLYLLLVAVLPTLALLVAAFRKYLFFRGVAYLWAWIGLPGGLYGTIWILALAFIARFMPDTVKVLSTSLMQIHPELEEASWLCGRGILGTIRSIVLPLARPGVIAAMTLLFILSVRELGSSLFLYSSRTMVMAVLLLDYYNQNINITAAFSIVQTVLLAVLIGFAHWLSRGAAESAITRVR